jgi:Uma2 family endonuclease
VNRGLSPANVAVAADLWWYPMEGRPDISKAPDVMVVLDHRAGERLSYKQGEENGRPPNVVFEFISKSNPADEMIDKLEFYSEMGCDEFFIDDYQRGSFHAFRRKGGPSLVQRPADPDGVWHSRSLGMTFGLDAHGRLWVRRPDGKLMESQRELARRADAATQRADEQAQRAERSAAKLRALGVDPESESAA